MSWPKGLSAVLILWIVGSSSARAAETTVVPKPVEIPSLLTFKDALRIFHEEGLDLLIADAAVMTAAGNVETAGAIRNPNASVGFGAILNQTPTPPCSGCSRLAMQWSLSDNAAALDSLSGKRELRVLSAKNALAVARLSRADAERVLTSQVKQLYIQIVFARRTLDFTLEIESSLKRTLELSEARYPGVVDRGFLARIEIQALEARQATAAARQTLRLAQVALGFLLGQRSEVPDFEVERTFLKLEVPPDLSVATQQSLHRAALAQRPDLRAAHYQELRAGASLDLARRQRLPDVALGISLSGAGTGQNAAAPVTVLGTLSTSAPVFYQQQGEIRRAEADLATQSLQHAKTAAQIVLDVDTAFASFLASRDLVARMEARLLERAKQARDILELQLKAGAASLIDFLDAERTYISTNIEYIQDLGLYWTSVFQLEQATGQVYTAD